MSADTINYFSAPSKQLIDQQQNSAKYQDQSFSYYYKNTFQPKLQKHESINQSFQDSKSQSKSQTKKQSISQKKNDISCYIIDQIDMPNKPHKLSQKKSLLPDLLKKKVNFKKTEIVVYFFNTNKKLTFQKQQISKLFQGSQNQNKKNVRNFIPFLVMSYCKLFLSFQPQQVNYESFELKLADFDNKEDNILDSIDPEQNITYLYDAGNLILTRKKRSKQRLLTWQKNIHQQKPDVDILQIIIPFQRQLVQKIQSYKTINHLKEKNSAINQLGKIVIVEYNNFKICDGKTKISQIPDKVLQIFRLKQVSFDDKPVRKILKPQNSLQKYKIQKISQCASNQDKQVSILIKDNYFSDVYINIKGTVIQQKFVGGFFSKLVKLKDKKRSVHNLVGISSQGTKVKLKFIYKDHEEIVSYEFKNNNDKKQQLMKTLIKLGRRYNKNFIKI